MVWKATEWESNGYWHCGCVEKLGQNSNYWTHPARILGLAPADYVKFVIDNYNPIVWHNTDCSLVFFKWRNQADMRRFKNFINKKAREVNYLI